jgi:putative membrane protein
MQKAVLLVAVLTLQALPAFATFASAPGDIHDGQIVHALVAANSTAIESGTLALSRSTDQAIIAFAKRMVNRHMEVSRKAIELLTTELQVALQHNPLSSSVKAEGEVSVDRLQTVPAEKFDRVFIDRTVAFYQNLLDMIDNELMPAASNEKLKALLYGLFAPFSRHLEEAQNLQQALHRLDARNH